MTKKKAPAKKRDPAEETPEEEAKWAAEQAERAKAIIECDDVLSLFAQSWRQLIAGEEPNAKLLYLIATSRLFDKCMNVAIKGPSSAGKSAIRQQVLNYFPPEAVVSFTTLSEKALLYFEEDFPHKILSMGEASGVEEQSLQDTLLRELISEGKLLYPVVQKKSDGGWSTVIVEKNGPVVFMVTTTLAALNAENETRMLSLEIDDSDLQTANVLRKVAEIVGMNADKAVVNYDPWHDYQRWLAAGNRTVVVPFAKELAAKIKPRSVRLRRDFSQVLLATKAHALLHRQHRPVDACGQIVADIDQDYRVAADLMGRIISEASGAGIGKTVQETIDAVTTATTNLPSYDGAPSAKIAKLLRLDQSPTWRRLNSAIDKGFVVNLETRHRQPGLYRVTNQEVEVEDLLPSPEDLVGALHTAHTCIRTGKPDKNQSDNVCKTVCKPVCIAEADKPNAYASAYGSAYVKPMTNKEKEVPYARMHRMQAGVEEDEPEAAASSTDPFAELRDSRHALKPKEDDWPDPPPKEKDPFA